MKFLLHLFENYSQQEISQKIPRKLLPNIMMASIFPFNFTLAHAFAYLGTSHLLEKLMAISKMHKIPLLLTQDYFSKTPLDIAIEQTNTTLINLMINALILTPPPLQGISHNFLDNFLILLKMRIPNLDNLLDSRLIEPPGEKPELGVYSKHSKTKAFNSLDVSFEEYEAMLDINKKNNQQNLKACKLQIKVLDIPHILAPEINFLRKLISLSSHHPIFASEGAFYFYIY